MNRVPDVNLCIGGILPEKSIGALVGGLVQSEAMPMALGAMFSYDTRTWLSYLERYIDSVSGGADAISLRVLCTAVDIHTLSERPSVKVFPILQICQSLDLPFYLTTFISKSGSLNRVNYTGWWAPGINGVQETSTWLINGETVPGVNGIRLRELVGKYDKKLLFDYEMIRELRQLMADHRIPSELPGFVITPTEPKLKDIKDTRRVLRLLDIGD